MARQTEADDDATDEENYDVDDVLGHSIYNPDRGMGQGVALDARTVRNGYGDERYVFVCHTEPGSSGTFRDVDDVLDDLNNGAYELREDPWADDR